ncbi:MAG: hypothetical protein AAF945_09105 [Actinomycetota bacterium]
MSGGPGQPDLSGAGEYTVEVRRPVHRAHPLQRFRERWSAQRAARRRTRRVQRDDGDDSTRWWEGIDLPADDAGVVLIVVAGIAAIVLLVIAAPFLWILVLFLVDLVVWLLLVGVSLAAWLIVRRPWTVVVVDRSGAEVASNPVRGRRAARQRADTARSRLAAGLSPSVALLDS